MRLVILLAVLSSLAFSCQAQEYTKTEGGRTYRCYEDPSPSVGEWCWEVTASTLKPTATTMRPATTIRPEDRPLAPGPGNGQCDPEIGEDCRTSTECSCLGGQTCDPSSGKANPRGCVSPSDAVKCPENAVAYGVDCVCREGYGWNAGRTACDKTGESACKNLFECPGKGSDYCGGDGRIYRYTCFSGKLGCVRQTVRDCPSAGNICLEGECRAKPRGCLKKDGICDFQGGEDCSNCPDDCGCDDLRCSPGTAGATSWGCFDPCLDVDNGYYSRALDSCECKRGFDWNGKRTDCVPANPCGWNSKMAGGACVCDRGYGDCDGIRDNGCEADFGVDGVNCGSCGKKCPRNAVCEGGKCGCPNGYVEEQGLSGGGCAPPGCDGDGSCDPGRGENCRNCFACACDATEMCNSFVSSPLTDDKGCRACAEFCLKIDPHYTFLAGGGVRCECSCEDGYTWDPELKRCSDGKPEWENVARKLSENKPLSPCEYILYLRKLEEANKDKTWKQIVTSLHKVYYGYDETKYPLIGRLYRDGPENAGWEDVDLLGRVGRTPKRIYDSSGEPIELGHSYAGLRGTLHRGRLSSWVYMKMSTDAGDKFQVLFMEDNSLLPAAKEASKSAFGAVWNRAWGDKDAAMKAEAAMADGYRNMTSAWMYYDWDQKRGDAAGGFLRDYFIENGDGRLSEAYRAYFRDAYRPFSRVKSIDCA